MDELRKALREHQQFVLTGIATKKRVAPHVMPDMQPYQVVGPEYGKCITSRSKHREYLKQHDLIEVGNERKYFDLDSHE